MRVVIDARLCELLPTPHDSYDRVGSVMHDGVLAPGKRTRPLLMLLVGRGLANESKPLLDLACALEMVHAASLFLGDLPCMDNAWLRRGRPAIHARYGQDAAMFGAMALLSQACGIVASVPDLPGALRAQLVQVLCEAVGARGLVRGQLCDRREGAPVPAAADITGASGQKTGALFDAALQIAALAAGASTEAQAALQAAASHLGQAFRLRDDLEDACDELADRIKDHCSEDGNSTLAARLGRDAVQRRLDAHLLQAREHLSAALAGNEGVVGLMLDACGLTVREPVEAPPVNPKPARFARSVAHRPALRLVR